MQKTTEDRRPKTFTWQHVTLFSVLTFLLQGHCLAVAQGIEVESNNTCQSAQSFGATVFPFTVDGSVDTSDVDFLQFTGPPGAVVTVQLIALTSGDSLLGFFDSSCNLISLNDDAEGLNSRLQFLIPEDGVFTLAATSYPDFGFTGAGGSSGPYQLILTQQVVIIGSISGRVVDAIARVLLRGDAFPFTFVSLYRCLGGICDEFVTGQVTDIEGRFTFTYDGAGFPLTTGQYLVRVSANQYQIGETAPFSVGEGEHRDLGDIRLTPLPLQFFSSIPCSNLPAGGGTCTYSVSVRNTTTTTFTGAVWSTVNAFGIGYPVNFSRFQTGKSSGNPSPQKLKVGPRQSASVQLQFDVPRRVAEGASFCAEGWLGQDPQPTFNTVGTSFLFCIIKEGGSFQVVPDEKAHKLYKKLKEKN